MTRVAALIVLLFTVTVAVTGCRADQSDATSLSYGLGNLSNAPMALLSLEIDEQPAAWPGIVMGGSAESFPRTSGGTFLASWQPDGPVEIAVTWIEVTTGRAYGAATAVDVADMSVESGIAGLGILLLPGGIMVVESDPVPTSTSITFKDLARVCATRRPDLDRDLMARGADVLDDFPLLPEALEFVTDPIIQPPCDPAKVGIDG